jgi:UDP-glucuronate decarboxylase
MIEGCVKMMACDDFVGPVNLGNPHEFSIRELAELVLEITGYKSPIVNKPLPEDDPVQRRPDISLAKERLDWEPRISLREGLEKTVAYFRKLVSW